MVLGNLSVSGRPTNLDNSARAYRLAVDAGGSCLDIFSLINYFSLLSPSFWEMAQYTVQPVLSKQLRDNQNVIT